jgi:hypothetical protein
MEIVAQLSIIKGSVSFNGKILCVGFFTFEIGENIFDYVIEY